MNEIATSPSSADQVNLLQGTSVFRCASHESAALRVSRKVPIFERLVGGLCLTSPAVEFLPGSSICTEAGKAALQWTNTLRWERKRLIGGLCLLRDMSRVDCMLWFSNYRHVVMFQDCHASLRIYG
jgi:hypothetical protein